MENLASEVDLLNLFPTEGEGSRNRWLIWNDPSIISLKSKIRNVGCVVVTGYDINLPRFDVVRALRKHFSPCGLVTDVCICVNNKKLLRRAFVYIVGENPTEKALLLSGSDVGGWKAIVEPYPFSENAGRSITVSVTGYDTSLSDIDLESALRKHFSSCGEISYVEINKKYALTDFHVDGEDAQDKVIELDGSHMGGHKLIVEIICGGVDTYHSKRHCYALNTGL